MGRKPRLHFPGAFYHCMNRGNQRKDLYCCDDDYRFMLTCMAEATGRWEVQIHGYCLMPNHFHLLLQVQEVSISTIMRSMLRKYASHFNQAHNLVGHVFQGRFRSILCDRQTYLLELLRYIHLNPVRAGLVEQPLQWPWSSLPAYLGHENIEWLHQKDVWEMLGSRPQRELTQLLAYPTHLDRVEIYAAEDFPILGPEEFTQLALKRNEPRRRHPRPYLGPKLSLSCLATLLCARENFPARYLQISHKGERRLTDLREKFVYLAIRILYHRQAEVARFLDRSSSPNSTENHS